MRLRCNAGAFFKDRHMKYYYRIAGRDILFDSDYPLWIDKDSSIFRESFPDGQCDLFCKILEKDEWIEPEGELLLETEERKLYYKNPKIVLEILNRKDHIPLFCLNSISGQKKCLELWAKKTEYPFIARMEHLWAAIDLPYQLLKYDLLTVHSASIQVDGKAILFLAPSGTGKSTQANLWNKFRGAELLNGDKAVLSYEEEKVYAYGLPFCGTSGICKNFKIPVQALVLLGQSEVNQIKKISGIFALKAVLENCFGHRKIPGCMEKIVTILGNILNKVEIYQLDCTPDERAVQLLERTLMEEV